MADYILDQVDLPNEVVFFIRKSLFKYDTSKLDWIKFSAGTKAKVVSGSVKFPRREAKGKRTFNSLYRINIKVPTLFGFYPRETSIAVGSVTYPVGGWDYIYEEVTFNTLEEDIVFYTNAFLYQFLKHSKQIEGGRRSWPQAYKFALKELEAWREFVSANQTLGV